MEGRQILDAVLVAKEVVDEYSCIGARRRIFYLRLTLRRCLIMWVGVLWIFSWKERALGVDEVDLRVFVIF